MTDQIETELKALYTRMLCACGFRPDDARAEVNKAIEMCKRAGEKEGTASLPSGFGDLILVAAKEGQRFAANRVNVARSEGATDEDIREFWNLHDLQRRMVLWSEEVFRFATFKDLLAKGLSADEAMMQVRGMFPMYGDPLETQHTTGDDRPLPHELRGRVDRYREKWGACVIAQGLSAHSSYNAFVRAELRSGRL